MNRLSERLGVSKVAASKAIQALVSANILVEKTGYARNRVFVADEALRILR